MYRVGRWHRALLGRAIPDTSFDEGLGEVLSFVDRISSWSENLPHGFKNPAGDSLDRPCCYFQGFHLLKEIRSSFRPPGRGFLLAPPPSNPFQQSF